MALKTSSKKIRSRKGQFFIIFTSILLFMIITIVLIRFSSTSANQPDKMGHYIFKNIQKDMERVVNIIMNINQTSLQVETTMNEYMIFLSNFTERHSLDFRAYYFIGLSSGSELNVTAGNFYDSSLTNINITITDATPLTTQQNITILTANNETTVSFDNAFSTYDSVTVNITHDTISSPMTFTTTVNSVFEVFYLQLGRNQDLWINRIIK